MATTARTLPVVAALLVLLGSGRPLLAQNADADEVKRVIREETESYYRRDADAWKGTWVQDSTAIRTFITSGSYSVALGWEKFGPATVETLRKDPTPQLVKVDRTNYVMRIEGPLAWAEYDERTNFPANSVPLLARQQRTVRVTEPRLRQGLLRIDLQAQKLVFQVQGDELCAVVVLLDVARAEVAAVGLG